MLLLYLTNLIFDLPKFIENFLGTLQRSECCGYYGAHAHHFQTVQSDATSFKNIAKSEVIIAFLNDSKRNFNDYHSAVSKH